MSRLQFQMGTDTLILIDRLREAQVGQVITYQELGKWLGRDFVDQRNCMYRAFKHLRDDHKIEFGTITGVGIKRLSEDEIVSKCKRGIQTLGRCAKRHSRPLTALDYEKLSDAKKVEHNVLLSIYGVVAYMSKPSSVKRVEGTVANSGALPIGRTLDAFK